MLLTMIVTFLYNKFADDMDFVFCSIKKKEFCRDLITKFSFDFERILQKSCTFNQVKILCFFFFFLY